MIHFLFGFLLGAGACAFAAKRFGWFNRAGNTIETKIP